MSGRVKLLLSLNESTFLRVSESGLFGDLVQQTENRDSDPLPEEVS